MILLIIIFILGLSIGSFLNVLIDRIPFGKSVIKGRSYCDHCKHKLAWFDLIPLLSFILLRRKCRYCRKLISWQYPLVELTTASLFVFTFASMIYIIEAEIFFITLLYALIIISGLITIFFTDLKYRIIPDQIIVFSIIISLIFGAVYNQANFLNNFLAGLAMFLLFLGLFLATRGRGMGLGDVKFAFLMGLLLGFPGVVVAFYLAFLTGAGISIILILMGKKTMKSTIPFGPFLVAATFVAMFYGDSLWIMFQRMMGI